MKKEVNITKRTRFDGAANTLHHGHGWATASKGLRFVANLHHSFLSIDLTATGGGIVASFTYKFATVKKAEKKLEELKKAGMATGYK